MIMDEEKSTPNKGSFTDRNGGLPWPESQSNFFARWSYSYMNPLLSKGRRETLTKDDLWNVPDNLRSSTLLNKFNSFPSDASFVKKMWWIASPSFLPAGFFQFVAVICQCFLPLLGRQLIILIENSPVNLLQQGIGYSFLLLAVTSANGVANQRLLYLSMKSGMLVRTTVVSAIYSTSLKLSPKGKLGLTSGEVTNLVAIDSQKLFEVIQDGHLLWSCPLSMIIVMGLLLWIQGPVTLIGMTVLVIMVPAVKLVVNLMQNARKLRVKYSDSRVQITTAMINGIQITKLNSYEKKFGEKINAKRKKEMKYLRRELFIWGWTLIFTVISPILATGATFIVYVFIHDKNILTASDTFTTLMLFSALRFPINLVGRLVGRLGQSLEASKRIAAFLSRETLVERNDSPSKNIENSDKVVTVKDGNFQIYCIEDEPIGKIDEEKKEEPGFSLSGIDFSLNRGDILAVVGPVGSGKSTLATSLIGETSASLGTSLHVTGHVAYASQLPFILNATFRENVLFGRPYDPVRYDSVIEACCLRADINLLPAGDSTEIGERGVTLSGGQKQRLSIARTVYAKPDVAIFDDPLSALDAGTSRNVCERLFTSKEKNNLLSSTAVILVTHSAHFLHQMDHILVLQDGKNIFYGKWDDLIEKKESFQSDFIDSLTQNVQEKKIEDNEGWESSNRDSAIHDETNAVMKKEGNDGHLMSIEEREKGLSSFKTWKIWFQGAGGWFFAIFQIILLGMDRSAYIATEWWLAKWTSASAGPITVFGKQLPSQLEGIEAQIKYVTIYVAIICVSCTSTALRTTWAVMGGARCAEKLFAKMTMSVLRAPMSFFDTTPLGRILNRFTYDVEVLDVQLSQSMSVTIIALSWFVAAISVMTSIIPWLILVLVPVTIAYLLIQLHYRKSSVDLQRLDAISRSPLQTMLSEVMDGAVTIRVFGQSQNFTDKFFVNMDSNNSAMLTFIAAHKWLGVRLEILSGVVIFAAFLFVSSLQKRAQLQPGLAALVIIWATNFTITIGYLMDSTAESEAAITSVERINAMSSLPQEKVVGNGQAPKDWPKEGILKFEKVFMRYRENLPYALKGLSLELPAGKRCGVVGRTGAGKSSLAVALFRLVEIESGTILLDDVDLSKLDLSEIRGRSRCMSIIPQDPVLFSGTMRDCLDPFNEWSDDIILEALNAVRLLKPDRGVDALDDFVSEGGSNFSVGERQLLCMARALIAKPKFLVLDEATASVDGETDKFIQNMLRTRFQGCTLLTIAHRLNTIMDYDIIIAMDKGTVAEMGSPKELLQNKNGILSRLIESTGEESATALRTMSLSN